MWYYFYMNTDIYGDCQICIGVPFTFVTNWSYTAFLAVSCNNIFHKFLNVICNCFSYIIFFDYFRFYVFSLVESIFNFSISHSSTSHFELGKSTFFAADNVTTPVAVFLKSSFVAWLETTSTFLSVWTV